MDQVLLRAVAHDDIEVPIAVQVPHRYTSGVGHVARVAEGTAPGEGTRPIVQIDQVLIIDVAHDDVKGAIVIQVS